MPGRLNKKDWIDAGLWVLAEHGAGAVRVERLAEMLSVTKGSFYWHFQDRGALLEALIEVWQVHATSDIIGQVEAQGGDANAKLHTLFSIVVQMDGRLDRAIRSWAAEDAMAQDALVEVDKRRLDYLESLFLAIGFSRAEAIARARLIYHALIGQFMMGTFASYRERLDECHDIILPMLVRRI
jgi:AcrR family transcriptional regulator